MIPLILQFMQPPASKPVFTLFFSHCQEVQMSKLAYSMQTACQMSTKYLQQANNNKPTTSG